jgi:hypothetical protein
MIFLATLVLIFAAQAGVVWVVRQLGSGPL